MNKNKGLKAVVIGGGVHGLSSAIALARKGLKVSLLEKRSGLMEATSRATQNRAHLGYHYPRSPETAVECIKGLEFFKKKYPESLFYVGEDYYLIEKNKSKTSFEEFRKFCDEVGLPYKIKNPPSRLWNKSEIEGSFKVDEPVYNPEILKRLLEKEASELSVNVRTGSKVIGIEEFNGKKRVIAYEENCKGYETDIIINSTYAYSNNVLKALGLEDEMTKYLLQNTEVIVARSKNTIPALTVMDGPFVTLLPFTDGGKDSRLFLVYDVVNSILDQREGYFLEDERRYDTNWGKMIKHGEKYFPFFRNLEYVGSLFGSRPVPIENLGDSRQTRIKSYKKKPGIYSILEGKFISAPLVAEDLVNKIKEDGLIK